MRLHAVGSGARLLRGRSSALNSAPDTNPEGGPVETSRRHLGPREAPEFGTPQPATSKAASPYGGTMPPSYGARTRSSHRALLARLFRSHTQGLTLTVHNIGPA